MEPVHRNTEGTLSAYLKNPSTHARSVAREAVSSLFLSLRALTHLEKNTQGSQELKQVSHYLRQLQTPLPPPTPGLPTQSTLPSTMEHRPEVAPRPVDAGLQSLLTLREKLLEEVDKLESTQSALAEDADALASTAALHGKLSVDAATAGDLVKAWKRKQRDEVSWVSAASWLLVVTSLYIFSRRLAWVFFVRLDDWIIFLISPWQWISLFLK